MDKYYAIYTFQRKNVKNFNFFYKNVTNFNVFFVVHCCALNIR